MTFFNARLVGISKTNWIKMRFEFTGGLKMMINIFKSYN